MIVEDYIDGSDKTWTPMTKCTNCVYEGRIIISTNSAIKDAKCPICGNQALRYIDEKESKDAR